MVIEKNYMRNIEKILSDSRISKANLEILRKFDAQGKLQQIATGTRQIRLITVRQLALFGNKNFKDMTKEDIEAFFTSLGELEAKTWTVKGSYIKFFFKWLYNSDEYPHNVKWINTSLKSKNRKLPTDLFTKEEIKAMAEAACSLSDRAFIMVLYESAGRIGEILSLKIKDVVVDQYGCVIVVNGKTGMRRIRLIQSSPDLILWINNHPNKDDRESSLFIYLSDKNRYKLFGKGLTYESAALTLKTLAQRAGIKKRVHPHLFRHSRLTELAKDFSESELKIMAGWTGSSNMAGVYVHLSGGDIERKLLEKNGLLNKPDVPDKETLKPKSCPRCREINPNTAKFCYVCGMALDMKVGIEIDPHLIESTIEKKMLEKHGLNKEGAESNYREPQTDEILLKGLIQFIIKVHPELVLEFLNNNGLNGNYLAASQIIPEKR